MRDRLYGFLDRKVFTGAAGIRLEERAVIYAVKSVRSAFFCVVKRSDSSASGIIVIPALILLVVAVIF